MPDMPLTAGSDQHCCDAPCRDRSPGIREDEAHAPAAT